MSYSARQGQYLGAMGIQRWVLRDAALDGAWVDSSAVSKQPASAAESVSARNEQASPAPAMAESAAQPVTAPVDHIATVDWDTLQRRVANCQHCAELVACRSQTVFGVGNRQAEWLIIGEAPGEDEDREGEPFVGPAGQLLNAMLAATGLQRRQVYLANVIHCRTPDKRDPHAKEAAACLPYLQRQIALVQPRMILLVGRVAAQQLLNSDAPLDTLRGRVHYYQETIPMIATCHPADLLRAPQEKRKAWEDLCLARRSLATT